MSNMRYNKTTHILSNEIHDMVQLHFRKFNTELSKRAGYRGFDQAVG